MVEVYVGIRDGRNWVDFLKLRIYIYIYYSEIYISLC